MYHEKPEKGICPKCSYSINWCACAEMCFHCEFYKNHTCKNSESGNFKLVLPFDNYCSKFNKKLKEYSLKVSEYL